MGLRFALFETKHQSNIDKEQQQTMTRKNTPMPITGKALEEVHQDEDKRFGCRAW